MRDRRWVAPALLAAAVFAGGVIASALRQPSSGLPLDPSSTSPSGTKAIVELIDELGGRVDVDRSLPDDGDDVTLLLVDTLDDEQRDQLEAWVDDGGRLILADPMSPLAPRRAGTTSFGLVEATLPRRCDVAALADVRRVSAESSTTYRIPDGAVGCFQREESAWLVLQEQGDGMQVSLGGPGFLTNGPLREADNALLVAALLVPAEGSRVQFLRPPRPGEAVNGDRTLSDLIPRSVKLAILQLAIAFAIVVLWRMRRLGKPVAEPQEVTLAGSDLVVAVGEMLQQSHSRAHALRLMIADVRRELCERLGVPPTMSDEALADAVAGRTGVPPDDVLNILAAPPPASDADVLRVAADAEALRQQVLAPATGP